MALGLAEPGRVEGGGSIGHGPCAGSGLGLNVPCSGCTGPPGPQAQAPGRTSQSGAGSLTELGSHPRPRWETQVVRRVSAGKNLI